jgi:putative phage-type endonuclease
VTADRKDVPSAVPAEVAERTSDRMTREEMRGWRPEPRPPEPDRSTFVGGSDIGAIVGVSERRTALDVWEAKLKLAEPLDESTARMLRHRSRLEAAVLDAFEEDRPDVRIVARNVRASLNTDPPFSAQIDAIGAIGVERVVVEAKTAADRMRYSWGESVDEIDAGYIAQVQWQLACTGYDRGFLAAMIGIDGELRVYEIVRDQTIIDYLQNEAVAFWSLVESRTPPRASSRRPTEVKRILARLTGTPVELSETAAKSLTKVFDLRARIAALEREKTWAEYDVFEEVRRAWRVPIDPTAPEPPEDAVLTHRGETVAVYPLRRRTSIDVERLRLEQPITYHQYSRASSYRVLSAPPKRSKR